MAQIVVSIDTADKSNSSITVDGKKLKNVYSAYVYGMDEPDYMSVEINQYEKGGDEEGALRKWTRLTASEKEQFEVKASEGEDPTPEAIDHKALAQALLRREIDS